MALALAMPATTVHAAPARPESSIPDATGRPLPPLVFVSREARPRGSLGLDRSTWAIPGLGPRGRTLVTGGRLMVRPPRGAARPLLPEGALLDVADPAVAWDGRTIVFAGVAAPDSSWRLYRVDADGAHLAQLTFTGRGLTPAEEAALPAALRRYDDFDPCWLPDGRLCFATTRFPEVSEIDGLPATNLWTMRADGGGLGRITAERNGGEEPTIDPVTGRIVYARWWFNRYLPSAQGAGSVTIDAAMAMPREPINHWQPVSVLPDGDGIKLAGGDARVRASMMVYQPALLADGTLVGVRPDNPTLSSALDLPRLQLFPGGFAEARPLATTPACAPMGLPDGRIVFSWAPDGGDMGLFVIDADGGRPARLVDLPGTHELDAALLAPRRRPPVLPALCQEPLPRLPYTDGETIYDSQHTFRFDCLNVFTNGPLDQPFPDAPLPQRGLRIRFWVPLSRPAAAGGDTLILYREAPVEDSGAVHEHDMPADTPMFEQLVDAEGRVLQTANGPAHVAGFNFARFGSGTKCVGCHTGHSALPPTKNYEEARWFNAAPGATVTASSLGPGCASARGAVDRRRNGPFSQVNWIAASQNSEKILLEWNSPIELKATVLYPVTSNLRSGTDLRILQSELILFRNGLELRRIAVNNSLKPGGTRVEFEPLLIDALEFRPLRSTGRVEGRVAAALGEIEAIARLPED